MLATVLVARHERLAVDRLAAGGVEVAEHLPLRQLAERNALTHGRLLAGRAVEQGEGVVERDDAILRIVDDEGLAHIGHGVVKPALRQLRESLGPHALGDVHDDAAIAAECALLVEHRHGAGLDP